MAADNNRDLVIQVDAAGANASIKSVNTSLSGLEKNAVSSAKGTASSQCAPLPMVAPRTTGICSSLPLGKYRSLASSYGKPSDDRPPGMTLSMTKAVVAGNAIHDVAKRACVALVN